jgi:hypothetical protein
MTITILTLLGMIVFTIYNACILGKFGVPNSLSNSFYLMNEVKKGLGYLFTIMMYIMAICLMPGWIEITETISEWSGNLTALPFLAASAIAFVGTAPGFKDSDHENKVHMISAYAAAAFSLLWCCVVCYSIAWITVPAAAIAVLISALATRTLKSCKIYWLEMIAFLATFATILLVQF